MSKCPHCQCELHGEKGKPRSPEQLRRFFGVLRAMHDHWPESASFQPHCTEHLRKWVLCAAGHRVVVKTMTLPNTDNASLAAAMMAIVEDLLAMDNRFGRWKGMTFSVYEAKSIAFHKLGQAEFNALNDAVEEIYRAETGLDPDQVLKESEKAA